MKNFIKKFNNFKLTAIVTSAIEVFTIITAAVMLLAYTFALDFDPVRKLLPGALYYVMEDMTPQLLGMVFFLASLFSVVLAVLVISQLIPNILNKDVVPTKKGFVIVAVVNGVLSLIAGVILLIALILHNIGYGGYTPVNNAWMFILGFILSIISALAAAFLILPLRRCEFFQPDIKK